MKQTMFQGIVAVAFAAILFQVHPRQLTGAPAGSQPALGQSLGGALDIALLLQPMRLVAVVAELGSFNKTIPDYL